jgi:hypothetical protein
MHKHARLLLGLGLAFFAISCATNIPVTITKPAEINMAGNRVIAVLDFRYSPDSREWTGGDLIRWAVTRLTGIELPARETPESRAADYATSRVIRTLIDTGYFQLVSPREISQALKGTVEADVSVTGIGKAVDAQAIINGELTVLETEDEEWILTRTVKDPDTGDPVKEEVPMIRRRAKVAMMYQVIDAETGVFIASRSFDDQDEASVEAAYASTLPSVDDMYMRIIDSFMPKMAKQLAPYQVTEHRFLKKDKTEDPRLEHADGLVRARAYEEALEMFLSVWEENGNFAAGYNAAILYEILGRLDEAIAQMQAVVAASGDRGAARQLQRLLAAKRDYQRLQEQMQ